MKSSCILLKSVGGFLECDFKLHRILYEVGVARSSFGKLSSKLPTSTKSDHSVVVALRARLSAATTLRVGVAQAKGRLDVTRVPTTTICMVLFTSASSFVSFRRSRPDSALQPASGTP